MFCSQRYDAFELETFSEKLVAHSHILGSYLTYSLYESVNKSIEILLLNQTEITEHTISASKSSISSGKTTIFRIGQRQQFKYGILHVMAAVRETLTSAH